MKTGQQKKQISHKASSSKVFQKKTQNLEEIPQNTLLTSLFQKELRKTKIESPILNNSFLSPGRNTHYENLSYNKMKKKAQKGKTSSVQMFIKTPQTPITRNICLLPDNSISPKTNEINSQTEFFNNKEPQKEIDKSRQLASELEQKNKLIEELKTALISSENEKQAINLSFALFYSMQTNYQIFLPFNISSNFLLKKDDICVDFNKPLGSGGFANVQNGTQKGNEAAIKSFEIPINKFKMLFNEIQAMVSIGNEPYIVKFYGICLERASNDFLKVYMVLEKMHRDVRKLVFDDKKKLKNSEKVKILCDVLMGLMKIHKKNFVHCDIKLQNILVDRNLNAKIGDFGINKFVQNGNTKNSKAFGFSERQSAYEQLIEEKISTKSDIWSFGILVYELWSEKNAWDGLTSPQVVAKISIKTPFFSGNQKTGNVLIDNIIESCVQYDHNKRPTAAELFAKLQQNSKQ